MKTFPTNRRFSLCLLFAGALLPLAGCNKEGPVAGGENEKHIRNLAIIYGRCSSMNRGKPPASADDIKKFIKSLDASGAESFGIDKANPDAAFVSPRDNQPYTVIYKVPAGPAAPGTTAAVIVYETQGVNGKHLVAYANAHVEEVDAAKLKQLVPGS